MIEFCARTSTSDLPLAIHSLHSTVINVAPTFVEAVPTASSTATDPPVTAATDAVELRRRTVPRKRNELNQRRSLDFAKGLVSMLPTPEETAVTRSDDDDGGDHGDLPTPPSHSPPPLPSSRPPTIVSSIMKPDYARSLESLHRIKPLKAERSVQFKSPDAAAAEHDGQDAARHSGAIFQPIHVSRSNENLLALLKPVPRYATQAALPTLSKSTQDLRSAASTADPEFFAAAPMWSASSDDLMPADVDGLRRSLRGYRRQRRHPHDHTTPSGSVRSLEQMPSAGVDRCLQLVREERMDGITVVGIVDAGTPDGVPEQPEPVDEPQRPPQPMPRKTVVYVFDQRADEFVLEAKLAPTDVTVTVKPPKPARMKFNFFGFGASGPKATASTAGPHVYGSQQIPSAAQITQQQQELFRIRSMDDLMETTSAASMKAQGQGASSQRRIAAGHATAGAVFYVPSPIVEAGVTNGICKCGTTDPETQSIHSPNLRRCCCCTCVVVVVVVVSCVRSIPLGRFVCFASVRCVLLSRCLLIDTNPLYLSHQAI